MIIRNAAPWSDDVGNRIEGSAIGEVEIRFDGRNGLVRFVGDVWFDGYLRLDADDAVIEIGHDSHFHGSIRAALGSRVTIGRGLSVTTNATLSAVEGATIAIGDDCMFASRVEIRTDDAHPIYDRATGRRVNPSRDIAIGDHVWLGNEAIVMGGATIGPGCVVGTRAIVKGTVPANCIAAGAPARVTRENVAWERPHLGMTPPHRFPDREPYPDDGA